MAWSQVLNKKNRGPGTFSFGPVSVPVGLSRVTARILRESWPVTSGSAAEIGIDLSLDGGGSWIPNHVWAAFPGGEYIDKNGVTLTYSTVSVSLPEPSNPNRRVRGNAVLYASLSCSIDLEII